MTTAPLFEADGLEAAYGGPPVLRELSFSIARGTVVALIGPNGAGKTTLLRVMAGDLAATRGVLRLDGQPVRSIHRRTRARRIAYVPPALDLVTDLSVSEFTALGRTPYAAGWRRWTVADRRAVDEALRVMDLTGYADRSVLALSEGEKHRAMIALGLAQEPEVLLLDEPTAHLDIKHAWQSMELIDRLHRERGVTIVMTSHDLNCAAEFCARLLLLDRGRLAAEGSPQEVLQAERLSAVYDYPIQVLSDPASHAPRVFPVRPPPPTPS